MQLRHFGFAFTQAICTIVVYISTLLFKTCFLLYFPLVPLSSRGTKTCNRAVYLKLHFPLRVHASKAFANTPVRDYGMPELCTVISSFSGS